MEYQIISAHEWTYPDSKVTDDGSRKIELSVARGSYAACQILFNSVVPESPMSWEYENRQENGLQNPEVYQLLDIYVEKNTGPVGFCVAEGESPQGYSTRLAPFRLFEALEPFNDNTQSRSDTEALYVCWKIPVDFIPGTYAGDLEIKIGEEKRAIPVSIEVHSAVVPAKETLSVINWFSLDNMAIRYDLEPWSEEHWAMIRRYGELMRRARQTHFWVPKEIVDVAQREDGTSLFSFEKAERLIRMFLGLGFSGIEGGLVAGRKDFKDAEFFIWTNGDPIKAVSTEGYAYLAQYLTAWRTFLDTNGWLGITLQHVADEPTETSKQEYRILSGIVRKFMPGVPLLEAVETFDLDGAVDIWIPKNSFYQENREEFEKFRALGDKLWFYTCCFPGGFYLNRLWDMPLLRTRFLHWGNYKYDLEGFLHWGLNHCDNDKDPFNQTDIFFPPGDTHITYPGSEGPLSSMRLEAMRAGIEDYELLRLLAGKNKVAADKIADCCLTSFNEANEDPAHFERVHRQLLHALSNGVTV